MAEYWELDAATRAHYDTTLVSSHKIRVKVRVYDQNEENGELLRGVVVGGQVDWDAKADISASLSLELMDPTSDLSFDPLGALYADKYIGVEYGVYLPANAAISWDAAWVDTPVFFGPVSRYSRDGDRVSVEAVGKESLVLPPVKYNVPSGTQPSNRSLKTVLRYFMAPSGEEKFRLATGTNKTVKVPARLGTLADLADTARASEKGIWRIMKEVAMASGYRLFYAGDGYLDLERIKTNAAVYRFEHPLSEPAVAYDLSEVRNVVQVWDQDAKAENKERAKVELGSNHPLSADSLGRNGKRRVLYERVEINVAKMSEADALDLARDTLDRRSQGVMDVQFEHLPVPYLRIGSKVEVPISGATHRFTLERFTLPLTSEDSMSVGYNRPIRKRRKSKGR
jgi:hypothetical protein